MRGNVSQYSLLPNGLVDPRQILGDASINGGETFAVPMAPGYDSNLRPCPIGSPAGDRSPRVAAAASLSIGAEANGSVVDFLVSVPLGFASCLVDEGKRYLLQRGSVLILLRVFHESPSSGDTRRHGDIFSVVCLGQTNWLNSTAQAEGSHGLDESDVCARAPPMLILVFGMNHDFLKSFHLTSWVGLPLVGDSQNCSPPVSSFATLLEAMSRGQKPSLVDDAGTAVRRVSIWRLFRKLDLPRPSVVSGVTAAHNTARPSANTALLG